MQKFLIERINNRIKKSRKAIISLGCSFVEGHGAIDDDIYQQYPWTANPSWMPVTRWGLSSAQTTELTERYPDVKLHQSGHLDWYEHENNRSFVSVLSNKYFNGEYAPINLGRRGCGNRATIKELYFYPNILWDQLEEIIVIYCPSGAERFDFIDDEYCNLNEHGRWICSWPTSVDDGKGARNKLWEGYRDSLYSNRFEILEQIAHVQELLTWCKYRNAKLIVVPAFTDQYNRQNFTKSLSATSMRRGGTRDFQKTVFKETTQDIEDVVNMWPWQNMFLPGNHSSFVDLVMHQEKMETGSGEYFYTYLGKGTPNRWITPCAHPSAKGHDLFAKYLHKHITENL